MIKSDITRRDSARLRSRGQVPKPIAADILAKIQKNAGTAWHSRVFIRAVPFAKSGIRTDATGDCPFAMTPICIRALYNITIGVTGMLPGSYNYCSSRALRAIRKGNSLKPGLY